MTALVIPESALFPSRVIRRSFFVPLRLPDHPRPFSATHSTHPSA